MSLFISCSLSKRQIFQVLELTKNKKTGGFHVILLHNYSFFALFIRFLPCLYVFLCIYSNRSTEIDFSFAVVCNTFLRMWVRSCLQMAGNLCGNTLKKRLGLPFFL